MIPARNKTTLSKTVETLVWVAVSGAIAALISRLSQNPNLFNPAVMAIVNIVLVALKNLFDSNTPNF